MRACSTTSVYSGREDGRTHVKYNIIKVGTIEKALDSQSDLRLGELDYFGRSHLGLLFNWVENDITLSLLG
eukprot:snap_masked-scaffold_46-processed-gene-0.44-mRNA-1 protein AED:1.00 eAED:1.00 QI:0/-1/0/0/-1/1/1/0/70